MSGQTAAGTYPGKPAGEVGEATARLLIGLERLQLLRQLRLVCSLLERLEAIPLRADSELRRRALLIHRAIRDRIASRLGL